jgi:hypothetical protein
LTDPCPPKQVISEAILSAPSGLFQDLLIHKDKSGGEDCVKQLKADALPGVFGTMQESCFQESA